MIFSRFFKRIPRAVTTVGSLAAMAAINYSLIQSPFVFIALLVLLSHELGHYFMARKSGAQVKLPIFLPLPFIAIAITKAKGLSNRSKMKVALSGPIVGFITALLIIVANFIFNIVSPVPLVALATGEIVFNFIGNDGKKYRSAKKAVLSCTY